MVGQQPAALGEHATLVGALDCLGEELEQCHALPLEAGTRREVPPLAGHDGQQPQHA